MNDRKPVRRPLPRHTELLLLSVILAALSLLAGLVGVGLTVASQGELTTMWGW